MTNRLKSDFAMAASRYSTSLPFESSSEIEKAGLRVTRAEFSRLMGCSKQSVTEWVQTGRITVGADGRFDPRCAVSQLLKTGSARRIKAKMLEPIVKEIEVANRRIEQLEAQLSQAKDDSAFHEEAVTDLFRLVESLPMRLSDKWEALRALDADSMSFLVAEWLDRSVEAGGEPGALMVQGRTPWKTN